MTRRGGKGGSDPLLNNAAWRGPIRDYWIRAALPCARCHGPIQYGAPMHYPGTKRVNPWSLVVGHVVGRDKARRLGWSDAQINAISNTQPECKACSDSSGARYGNRLRGAMLSVVRQRPATDTSRDW